MTESPPAARDLIRYDLLVQEALKGVVRKVLSDACKDGLPGEHHFYVSFRTDYPGVRLSQRMREKYPEEMTIVLQHQFWDLGVSDHAFEVGLSFSGVPERLFVPFDSVVGFFDPSVQFGLKFELNGETAEPAAAEPAARKPTIRAVADSDKDDARKTAEPGKMPTPAAAAPAKPSTAKTEAARPVAAKPEASGSEPAKADAPKPEPVDDAEGPPRVVSLDAFRKKPDRA